MMSRSCGSNKNGATCHTAHATIDLLKGTFGDRLISRFGPVNWSPRSCDLTPLDYFLLGYVKSLVHADKPQTLDHLENNIHLVIADIRPQMLEKVIENWTSRLDYIRASHGSPMPEIIFKIPISLTCIIRKLSERVFVKRIQYYLDNCDHISEKQAGFRLGYNITEQIVRLTQHIKNGFQKKQSTLAVFVDSKSAFDRVWRKILLKTLLHRNVADHIFKSISDFLSQHFLNIKYGDSRSGYGQTRQALPQRSFLSPVLFNIMINDLLSFTDNAVPQINSLLYADDLVFWSTGYDLPKLETTLNMALVTLSNWSLENERERERL
ncbi:putative RNA-directed DNA polymerase from transposon BS [Trichonephila clavipes]|nr:putative RNA-directed DNA polymerase from transposon BS [Trichonephila clavipes]